MGFDLTILITTINEAKNLERLLPELKALFHGEKAKYEVLIIDGSSTDNTVEVARRFGCRVEIQSQPGYAAAIRQGISGSKGDYVIVMDADLSHRPEDARQLYRNRQRADIVINSRYLPGGGSESTFGRRALSGVLNWVYRMVLGLPFREISGGFRIYRREVLESFELESVFYEVQEELLAVPYWLGFSAVEIPYWYRARGKGSSKARLFAYGYHLILALKRFRKIKKELLAERQKSKRPAPAVRARKRRLTSHH